MVSKKHIPRYISQYAFDNALVGNHMVFLAGPRQVGKTMLAKNWLEHHDCLSLYYNWDDRAVRQAYLSDSRFFEPAARSISGKNPWLVFDEIHKRNQWRDILKSAYDLFGDEFRFLVTGSARLDMFRRAGDSLVGRYNLFHMMPFSPPEILGRPFSPCFLQEENAQKRVTMFTRKIEEPNAPEVREVFEALYRYGPFPEPFLSQHVRFCRKWHQDYSTLLLREDLRDISRVVQLDKIEHLFDLLASRVAAPLSMANLARELETAHTTVKSWLEQLKRLYLIFAVSPWSTKISRGLKKEKKWYYLDWYYVSQDSARLENMVATMLYRTCHILTDMGFGNFRLHYVRTLDKREIDFVVARDNKPLLLVEVKKSDTNLSRQMRDRQRWHFGADTIGVQVVDKEDYLQKYKGNTWIVSVDKFFTLLN